MNEEFWAQVEKAYLEAAQLSPEARTPFLHQAYPDRPDIQQEVESLLQYQGAGSRLDPSAAAAVASEMFGEDQLVGTVVAGKYRVRKWLGAGGEAEVYLADHLV